VAASVTKKKSGPSAVQAVPSLICLLSKLASIASRSLASCPGPCSEASAMSSGAVSLPFDGPPAASKETEGIVSKKMIVASFLIDRQIYSISVAGLFGGRSGFVLE
jgi:hypothetical protein